MNGGILSMNGGRVKNQPVVGEKGTEKGTVTNINTPQLTRLGERTIKMFELHREMIANTPETRYAVIQASFAIETMFAETGGKIWQELADRFRQDKTKDSS